MYITVVYNMLLYYKSCIYVSEETVKGQYGIEVPTSELVLTTT